MLKRHNVPVEHLPSERVWRWVYCSVSVLERWRNGKKKEVRREKSESARDSMVRVAEGEREAEKESDQGRRGKAEK